MVPEKKRWNAVPSKVRVWGDAVGRVTRRATHWRSSSPMRAVPVISLPLTRPSNVPNWLPLGLVAVNFKLLSWTVPSILISLRLPVSLSPSTLSSTLAGATSSPKLTKLKTHEPAISAAIRVGAKANNSSGSFFIFYSPFRALTINYLAEQTKPGGTLRRSVCVADGMSIVRKRFPGGVAPLPSKRSVWLNSSDIPNERFLDWGIEEVL